MIAWLASKKKFHFTSLIFTSNIEHHYGFSKYFKYLKFSLSQSPLGTETVQQISELWVKYKKHCSGS